MSYRPEAEAHLNAKEGEHMRVETFTSCMNVSLNVLLKVLIANANMLRSLRGCNPCLVLERITTEDLLTMSYDYIHSFAGCVSYLSCSAPVQVFISLREMTTQPRNFRLT